MPDYTAGGGATAEEIWEYITRTLTSAENITSDGNPIDQSKIAKLTNLDVAVSTRSSHSPADVWSYSNRTLTGIFNYAERSSDNIVFKQYKRYYFSFTEDVVGIWKTMYKVKIYLTGNIRIYLKCRCIDITTDWRLRRNGTIISSWTVSSSTSWTEKEFELKGVGTGDIIDVQAKSHGWAGSHLGEITDFTIYAYPCYTEILPADASEAG